MVVLRLRFGVVPWIGGCEGQSRRVVRGGRLVGFVMFRGMGCFGCYCSRLD